MKVMPEDMSAFAELRLSDLFRHLPLTVGLQLFQSFFSNFLNRIGGYAVTYTSSMLKG